MFFNYSKAVMREEVIEFVRDYSWKYFVTLTFKHGVKDNIEVGSIVDKFIGKLSSYVYGKRSKKRIKSFPVVEQHASGDLHVHVLLEDEVLRASNREKKKEYPFKDLVKLAWLRSSSKTSIAGFNSGSTDEWFKEVSCIDGALFYMTKEMTISNRHPVLYECVNLSGRR